MPDSLDYGLNLFFKGGKQAKTRKDRLIRLQIDNMLKRTSKMFKWNGEGIGDTVTERYLELMIQTHGLIGIARVDNKPYALWGNTGGLPNAEYMFTQFIVANPYLKLNRTYNIYDFIDEAGNEQKRDCVVIPNDCLYQGLIPTLTYHSELLTEIQLTKRLVTILHRAPVLLTAPTSNAKMDIDAFVKDIEEGEFKSIFDKNILKDINSVNMNGNSSRNNITQVLELEQYQKAALFNDIGLQMNYNMKRETITSSEAQLGESALLPLCDDMYEQRQLACKRLKEVLDLDWTCEFASAWSDLRKSIQVEMDIKEKEAETVSDSDNSTQVENKEESENAEKKTD